MTASSAPVTTLSPWLETPAAQFQPLNADLTLDVAVIGGGITGLTTAWLLKQSGCRVAVIERGRIGAADTGHTSAHLTVVTDTRLHILASRACAPPSARI